MTAYEQAIEKLLYEAKFACEEMRAQYGYPDPKDQNEVQPPTWLAELEHAITDVELAN